MSTAKFAKKIAHISVRTSRQIKETIQQAAAIKGCSMSSFVFDNLAELFKDSAHKLTQFKSEKIAAFEAGIAIEQDEAAGMAYLTREGALT